MTPDPRARIDWWLIAVWAALGAGVVLAAVVACAVLTIVARVGPRVLAWALGIVDAVGDIVAANPRLLAVAVVGVVVAVALLARKDPSW